MREIPRSRDQYYLRLQISEVSVLPSVWSEPFGRTIESMACGTPVVASKTGGIPEILTGEFQNGLLSLKMRDLANTLNHKMNWRNVDPHLVKDAANTF